MPPSPPRIDEFAVKLIFMTVTQSRLARSAPALLLGLTLLLAGCGSSSLSREEEDARSSAFLAAASAKQGAITTPTGLVYRELEAGTGPMPTASNKVRVHYRGTLVDGTEFDSSLDGEPLEFPLDGVIPCWTEGVQMMRTGGKAELVCPAEIAYGDRGAGSDIPPGAALVFEVQLLDIVQ